MAGYSNLWALRSLVKASLQSILKSPSAIVFSIAFPLIFIVVFGFLGGGKGFSLKVAVAPGSDTANSLYTSLRAVSAFRWVNYPGEKEISKAISEGDIVASIYIRENGLGVSPRFQVSINGAKAQAERLAQLRTIINQVVQQQDPEIARRTAALATVDVADKDIRQLKTIDFILPGQLGFSLLAGSVFGTAFVFLSMRQTLVLKRFFATPVSREVIVLSEGISRMIFQLLTAVVIIVMGNLVFGFHLIHGVFTILQMLLLCVIGVMVFMGFGFIISGLARNEAAVPPLANIITMPQFLLAGTFFPVESFPKWLQPVSRALPLTYLNDALRRTAFEGAGLWDLKLDLLVMIGWGVIAYVVAGRVFRWE